MNKINANFVYQGISGTVRNGFIQWGGSGFQWDAAPEGMHYAIQMALI